MKFGIVLAVLLILGTMLPLSGAQAQTATGCQFLTGGGPAAFCDTFASASPTVPGERRGQMAPIWGVSRFTGNANLNQYYENDWADTDIVMCDGSVKRVSPPNDIQFCNGQLREAINDTGLNDLAMYPRQPFDISGGRTGTVTFDVSDDSGGGHQAWPSFSFTDQPIPAPVQSPGGFGSANLPRNGLTIEFDAFDGTCTGPGGSTISTNYVLSDVNFVNDGCVLPPPVNQNTFAMNHVEIKISQQRLEVWMSDAGTTNMKMVRHADNVNLPLTRGLVWIRDMHYSGNKICQEEPGIFCQGMHTFAWRNFGFDGPALPQDVGIELPDRMFLDTGCGCNPDNGYPVHQLGWPHNAGVDSGHQIMNFAGNYALHDVEHATGALLEMVLDGPYPITFNIAINGHPAHQFSWDHFTGSQAIPIPLAELVDGNNTIDFYPADPPDALWGLSEIDLILIGAGGGGSPTPTLTPSVTASPSATPTLIRTPTATSTNTPTALPSATSTATPTSTVTIPTGTPTDTPTGTPTVTATITASPTPGQRFSISMNSGDSVQLSCSGTRIVTVTHTQNSDVLKCN